MCYVLIKDENACSLKIILSWAFNAKIVMISSCCYIRGITYKFVGIFFSEWISTAAGICCTKQHLHLLLLHHVHNRGRIPIRRSQTSSRPCSGTDLEQQQHAKTSCPTTTPSYRTIRTFKNIQNTNVALSGSWLLFFHLPLVHNLLLWMPSTGGNVHCLPSSESEAIFGTKLLKWLEGDGCHYTHWWKGLFDPPLM